MTHRINPITIIQELNNNNQTIQNIHNRHTINLFQLYFRGIKRFNSKKMFLYPHNLLFSNKLHLETFFSIDTLVSPDRSPNGLQTYLIYSSKIKNSTYNCTDFSELLILHINNLTNLLHCRSRYKTGGSHRFKYKMDGTYILDV